MKNIERESTTAVLAGSPGSWTRGQVDLVGEMAYCWSMWSTGGQDVCQDVTMRRVGCYQGSVLVATRSKFGREEDETLFAVKKEPV